MIVWQQEFCTNYWTAEAQQAVSTTTKIIQKNLNKKKNIDKWISFPFLKLKIETYMTNDYESR